MTPAVPDRGYWWLTGGYSSARHFRHGIRTFILPARNASDLSELPPEVRNSIKFVPVQTLEEVLRVALPTAEADKHA